MQIHKCAPPTEAPNEVTETWCCPDCGRIWEATSPTADDESSSELRWVPSGGGPPGDGPRSGWISTD